MWEKGKLANQPLINYVMNHDKDTFCQYVEKVANEMYRRNINFQYKYIVEFVNFGKEDGYGLAVNKKYPEHNDRYLKQCYYNLQEKHDRGMISDIEWKSIELLMEKEVI